MKGCHFLGVFIGLLIFGSNSFAQIKQGQVKAETGGIAIGRDVRDSTIVIGIPAEQIDELVRERTKPLEDLSASQKETIVLLKDKLNLNERQVSAALETVGEKNIPPERLGAKLIEIAEKFKELQTAAAAQPGDDAKITALKAEAQKAIQEGELGKADDLLAAIEKIQTEALDRLALNAAQTTAQRGDVALTRLRYIEAAQHFAKAARLLPQTDDFSEQKSKYLDDEASALYRQGDEFGDNAALVSAIDRYKALLLMRPRERVPLDWAMTQNNLGIALERLGERESGTGKLEEAVAAYREALKEDTRERVPLDWAGTQMNLGNALATLGERESGTGKLEEAVAAYREALKERTRERVPLDWAGTQTNLGRALERLGERESGTGKLMEAVAAYREALKEYTPQTEPTNYQRTRDNLNRVLTLLKKKRNKKAAVH